MRIKLLDYKALKDFSPGHGIEAFNEQIYLQGEDPRVILRMDTNWKIQEDNNKPAVAEPGITKEVLSDLRATTIIQINKVPFILMAGSGALTGGGNKAVLMNLSSRAIETFDLTVFYTRIKQSGLEHLNINAITVLNDKLVLCNPAGNMNPSNHIIITSGDFWNNQQLADIRIVKIELEDKAGSSSAISTLTYSYLNDWLISTVSTQNSEAASDGECAIGVVKDASRKIGRKRFKINEHFNLAEVDKKLKGQQVQSLCIQTDKERKLKLHLVGNNSKTGNFLFKMRLKD